MPITASGKTNFLGYVFPLHSPPAKFTEVLASKTIQAITIIHLDGRQCPWCTRTRVELSCNCRESQKVIILPRFASMLDEGRASSANYSCAECLMGSLNGDMHALQIHASHVCSTRH